MKSNSRSPSPNSRGNVSTGSHSYDTLYDSFSSSQISMEADLQRDIENNLRRIQKVASKFCLLDEEHKALKTMLDHERGAYNSKKHSLKFQNNQMKLQAFTHEKKRKIVRFIETY